MFKLRGKVELDTAGFKSGIDDIKGGTKNIESGASGATSKVGSLVKGLVGLKIGGDIAKYVGGTFMEFEKTMSGVKSKISGVTNEEMVQLNSKAKEMGRLLPASASDAGEAMQNLASAGYDANQIMESIEGTLFLASAGAIDMNTSSEIVVGTLSAFGKSASEATHASDVFARATADTKTDIVGMGESMKYVAPNAHAMGISLEETAGAIGLLGNANIQGSQAGTTLRAMLKSLTGGTKTAKVAMDSIGFSAFDTNGKMKPLSQSISELTEKTSGMTDEQKMLTLQQIFGQESMAGVLALMEQGGGTLAEFTKGLEECDGASKDMALTQTDNVYGALENVKGQFETVALNIGDVFAPAVKDGLNLIADFVPQAFGWIETIPEKLQEWSGLITPVFETIGELVQTVFTDVFQFIVDNVLPNFDGAVQTIFPLALETIQSVFEGIKAVWDNLLMPTIRAFAPLVQSVFSQIVPIIEGFLHVLKGLADFISGVFTGDWSKAWNGVKEIFSGVFETMKGIVKGFLGFVKGVFDTIDNLITGVGSVVSKVAGTNKGGGKGKANANGTSYFSGGATAIHERGGEMQVLPSGQSIIPADRTKEMIENKNTVNNSGGNTIVINVQTNNADVLVNELQSRLENM